MSAMSVTAFFEFVRLLYFADFHWGYKKSGSFAFFLVVSLQKKMKKSCSNPLKRNVAVVYLHPHFREAARRLRASLLHHCCITAVSLLIPYNIIHL